MKGVNKRGRQKERSGKGRWTKPRAKRNIPLEDPCSATLPTVKKKKDYREGGNRKREK